MVPVQPSASSPRASTPGRPQIELRRCGDLAVIVELPDAELRRALDARLRADPLPGTVEHVPAARTVLVRFDSPAALSAGTAALRDVRLEPGRQEPAEAAEPITLAVRYDGPDLAEVAELLDISPDEVIARHTGQIWTVEFAGFMPGFGYLTGDAGNLEVPRRETPRKKVPAGSVALAGPFTSVYPQASPGGWQLIGTTDEIMFDAARTPPALLAPGNRIRFEALR